MGELYTRMYGLLQIEVLSSEHFDMFDTLHYEVENKLLALIKSLQQKIVVKDWIEIIQEPIHVYTKNK